MATRGTDAASGDPGETGRAPPPLPPTSPESPSGRDTTAPTRRAPPPGSSLAHEGETAAESPAPASRGTVAGTPAPIESRYPGPSSVAGTPPPAEEAKTGTVRLSSDAANPPMPVDVLRSRADAPGGAQRAGHSLLPAPRRTEAYSIVGELGRGGMGIVFRAFDRNLRRDVALKVLRNAALATTEDAVRFVEEAQATAQLQHPGIVPVYEVAVADDGAPCFAMKLVEGRNLLDEIRRARLLESGGAPAGIEPPLTRLHMVRNLVQVCHAVAYAHARGVIHRDLKPQNIMLGGYGEVLVMDWGLAKVVAPFTPTPAGGIVFSAERPASPGAATHPAGASASADTSANPPRPAEPADMPWGSGVRPAPPSFATVGDEGPSGGRLWHENLRRTTLSVDTLRDARTETVFGSIVGTPSYMAPEQAAGRSHQVGPASDVYALGATLYQILTGVPPFSGQDSMEIAERVIRQPPPPPRRVDPSAEPELEAICLHAMEKRPQDRYASATDMARDLECYLDGLPVSVYPEGPVGRAQKWARRHKQAARGIAFAVILALVSSLVALVNVERSRSDLEVAKARTDRALLETQAERRRADEKRAEADRALARFFGETARRSLGSGDALAAEVLFAKALTLDDARSLREGLIEARVRGARLARFGTRQTAGVGVAFTPDGRRIAYPTEPAGVIRIVDARTLAEEEALEGHTDEVNDLAWSPDGARLASVSSDGTTRLWQVRPEAGVPRMRLLGPPTAKVYAVAFSPDGALIVSGGEDRMLHVFDARSGVEVKRIEGHEATIFGLGFRPDGRMLASASWDSTTRLWEPPRVRPNTGVLDQLGAEGGALIRVIREPAGWNTRVAWRGDGKRLAVGNDRTTIQIYDPETGETVGTLAGHKRQVGHIAWSPDGGRLAATADDGTCRLYDMTSMREAFSIRGRSFESIGVGCSYAPSGLHVALAGCNRRLELWDVSDPPEVRTLRGHSREAAGVAFSPDGRRVLSSAWDGTLRVWDVAEGRELFRLAEGIDKLEEVAWGRLGRHVAVGGWDKLVRIFDVEARTLTAVLEGHTGWVAAIALSPDERRLASASDDGTCRIWDIARKKELRRVSTDLGGVLCVAWRADGARIAIGCADKTVRVFDPETGKILLTLRGHEQDVEGVAFSPDGKQLVTGSWDRTSRLWDLETGECLRTFATHEGWVYAQAWSPDGARFASASEDGTVRIYEAASGRELLVCRGHHGEVQTVAWSPDGSRIASASYDATVRLWNLDVIEADLRAPPGSLVREAERNAGLSVTLLDPIESDMEPVAPSGTGRVR